MGLERKGGCKDGSSRDSNGYTCVGVCVSELVRSGICACGGHAGVHLRFFTFHL